MNFETCAMGKNPAIWLISLSTLFVYAQGETRRDKATFFWNPNDVVYLYIWHSARPHLRVCKSNSQQGSQILQPYWLTENFAATIASASWGHRVLYYGTYTGEVGGIWILWHDSRPQFKFVQQGGPEFFQGTQNWFSGREYTYKIAVKFTKIIS